MKELDYGNCGIVRFRGEEAYVKDMGLRTGTGYKAGMAGELAQHSEALSSAMKVNPEVVYRYSMLLPGEASSTRVTGLDVPSRSRGSFSNGRIEGRGVSRGRISRMKRAGVAAGGVPVQRRYPDGSLAMKDRTREADSYPCNLCFAGGGMVENNGPPIDWIHVSTY